jgi:tetratricopeptide (TPR) repeat protein
LDNLEYIEAYFSEELTPEKKREFEQRITADPVFAEEIAFYLSSKQAIAAAAIQQRERFKEVYAEYKRETHAKKKPALIRKLWPWAAAAAILVAIIFGWNFWFNSPSSEELADKYVKENFQTLPVTMGNKEDSLQTGLRLYNANRLEEALKRFENLALNDTSFFEAKKYAGIVSLRLKQYDKAIDYFSQLANYSQLYANPGKFYHALTLMKRNRPGDSENAKQLLREVVENDLEEKKVAEEWLKKW